MKHALLTLTVLLVAPASLHAADEPPAFDDPQPQRYQFIARASQIDPRARPHPELEFVLEKGGQPADTEHAAVDTHVPPQGKLVIWLMGHSTPLFDRVNSYGLHAIRVHYANGWFSKFGNAAPPDDDKFLEKIRPDRKRGQEPAALRQHPPPHHRRRREERCPSRAQFRRARRRSGEGRHRQVPP